MLDPWSQPVGRATDAPGVSGGGIGSAAGPSRGSAAAGNFLTPGTGAAGTEGGAPLALGPVQGYSEEGSPFSGRRQPGFTRSLDTGHTFGL